MNNKFDELAKGLAQTVTRRGALKKFGVGFAGIVLASLGLANKAEAKGPPCHKFICDCSGTVDSWGCDPQARNFDRCLACCGPHCA